MLIDTLNGYLEELAKPPLCSMGKWLKSQDDEIKEVFAVIMEKPKVNFAALFKALEGHELPFKLTTFKSHMKRECQCPHQQ